MFLLFLSGGTGTPKLLQGVREIVSDEEIGVVCNTGDDFNWYGLHVSPDLDTVLYLFSGKLDTTKYWGRKEETFNALSAIGSLSLDTWFQVGDKDLGLHLARTHLMEKGKSLEHVTQLICNNWGIKAKIYPMANDPMTTYILTPKGKLHFQEYFVKYKTDIEVKDIVFSGTTEVPETVKESFKNANAVIIGPSNPITSIGPILAVDGYRNLLSKSKIPIIAISPIIGKRAFSGPTAKLMQVKGYDSTVLGLAKYYQGLIDILVIDKNDSQYRKQIKEYGIDVCIENIDLSTKEKKIESAKVLLELID